MVGWFGARESERKRGALESQGGHIATLGLALALTACGGATLKSPAAGGSPWIELRSDHFLLHTDAGAGRASDLIAEMETAFSALEQYAFPYQPAYRNVVDVTFFRGMKDLTELGYPKFNGLYSSGLEGFTGQTSIVAAGQNTPTAYRQVLTHELTHRFIGYHFLSPPTWLNEGLAQYYESLFWQGDELVFGTHPLTGPQKERGRDVLFSYRVQPSEVLSVPQLAALPSSAFYGPESHAHYVSSWSAVAALMEHDARPLFEKYLDEVHAGQIAEPDALTHLMSGVRPDALLARQRDLMSNIDRVVELRTLRGVKPPSYSEQTPVSMSPAAVHRLWARLLAASDLLGAIEQATMAVRADPDDPEGRLTLAACLAQSDRPAHQEEAAREMARGFDAAPESSRLAAGLVLLDLRRPGSIPRVRDAATRLARSARSAHELDALSRYLLREGRTATASRFIKKSIELDPARPSAWVTQAEILAAEGQYEPAIALVERAIRLSGHTSSRPLDDLLRRYRAELASDRGRPSEHAATPGRP